MANRLKAAVLEQVDEKIDLFTLPDADVTEGKEPDYRLVVPRTLLLLLGAFLLLRPFVRSPNRTVTSTAPMRLKMWPPNRMVKASPLCG